VNHRSWTALWVVLLGACSSRDPNVVRFEVGAVVVEGAGLGEERVREAVRAGLDRSPLFEAGGGHLELRVQARVVAEADPPTLEVALAMPPPSELRAQLPAGFRATVQVSATGLAAVSPASSLPLAVERGSAVFEAQLLLARGGVAGAQQVLASEDPGLQLVALDWLREEIERGAQVLQREPLADRAASLLTSQDRDVAAAAIEVLGYVGTAADVPRLVRDARWSEPEAAFRLFGALERLGGADAEHFLELAVRNEGDRRLATAAAGALERLRGRTETGVASGPDRANIPRGHR
jgi:hypothetical protein